MLFVTACLQKKFRIGLLIIPAILPLQTGHAAGLVEDAGLWSQIDGVVNLEQYNPKLERFLLAATGEARFFDDFNHLSQGIIRVMPGFRFNDNITLFFGYTWVPNNPVRGRSFDEHDINQIFNWSLNPDWGELKTRTMVEWRFVSNASQMAVRLRQRIRVKYPLIALNPRLSLIGWEEFFINTHTVDWGPESGFDQNRAFTGFGWQLDKRAHFSLELGYMNQYIHHPGRDDLMNHMLFTSLQFKF